MEYLENCYKGEFINGTMETMAKKLDQDKISNLTKIPLIESLPKPPPHSCKDEHEEGAKCLQCEKYRAWWKQYKDEVDEIVYQSNVHKCKDRLTVYKKVKKGENADKSQEDKREDKTEFDNRGCRDPRTRLCKARFPRDVHSATIVDPESGALIIKKGEAWLNTYTPCISYLLCCSYDVTSLMSGTAIKSVIAYVADYMIKTPLKTHVMFRSV